MPLEKSAGAVIFRKNREIKYLLLHYPSGSRNKKDYWDFSKGHIEENETDRDTVIREIREETGLNDIQFIEGFKEYIKYFFKSKNQTIFKTVVFYLVKTEKKDVKVSSEHNDYRWLFYEEALEQLNFDNAKEILKKANQFLETITKH